MSRVAIAVLLTVGVSVQVFAAIGVMRMRDACQRLHYAAAASTVGPFMIAIAVVVKERLSTTGLKALLLAVVILAGGALVVHATGRATRIRELDGWSIRDDEIEEPAP